MNRADRVTKAQAKFLLTQQQGNLSSTHSKRIRRAAAHKVSEWFGPTSLHPVQTIANRSTRPIALSFGQESERFRAAAQNRNRQTQKARSRFRPKLDQRSCFFQLL